MSKLATPQFWQTMVAKKNMVRKKDATFVANFGKKMSIMCRAQGRMLKKVWRAVVTALNQTHA